MRKLILMSAMFAFFGCAAMSMTPPAESGGMPKDGELAFPGNYKSFPTFIKGVQKPNAIRDLYINKTGAEAHLGKPFDNGSILVMEVYNAQKDANGGFEKDSEGNLIKDGLAKVLVMQKGEGWGMQAPEGLKNGDWIYAAFKTNGDRLKPDHTKCRSCHLPLGDSKDYVHRYDEYFEKRGHTH